VRMLHLSRDLPVAAPKDDAAHVIVYLPQFTAFTPSVYYDDRDLGRLKDHRYFNVAVPPGTHRFSSTDEESAAQIEAMPGAIYYVRLARSLSRPKLPSILRTSGGPDANFFSVQEVDSSMARAEVKGLKPAGRAQILMPDVISVAPLPK
jgi:hypothetical protein